MRSIYYVYGLQYKNGWTVVFDKKDSWTFNFAHVEIMNFQHSKN